MPVASCRVCKNKFYAKPSWLKRGWGKYCSQQCQFTANRRGRFVNCYICNKTVWRAPKKLEHSQSKKFFCSKSCQTKWRNSIVFVGPNHANWRGGSNVNYRNVLIKNNIKQICKKCKTPDKRILAAHHIDEDRGNNKLENLVWLCPNCHFLIHHYENEKRTLMETLV